MSLSSFSNRVIPIYKAVLLSFVILTGISCSDSDESCAFIVDTVSIIDQRKIGGVTYYLVLRISGWHDKIEVIELYDEHPSFDFCAKSTTKPVYSDSLDTEDFQGARQMVSHIYFDVKNKRVTIEYISGEPEKTYHEHLKIELKDDD